MCDCPFFVDLSEKKYEQTKTLFYFCANDTHSFSKVAALPTLADAGWPKMSVIQGNGCRLQSWFDSKLCRLDTNAIQEGSDRSK